MSGHFVDGLYRQYASWLRRVLARRYGPSEAEELTQEAFSRVVRYDGAASLSRPRAALVTIASNAAFERHRRYSIRAPDAVAAIELELPEIGQAADQDFQILLKQIVMGLPPKLREVFVLSRFEGLTYPEIAQRCGISVKTVEWRMTKALDICSARLRD